MPAKHWHRHKHGQVWSPLLRDQIRAGRIVAGFFAPPWDDWYDALRVIALLDKSSVPWCLAHPFRSAIWDHPFVRSRDMTEKVDVDLCAYGQAAKRTTRFLFGHVNQQDVDSLRAKRCTGRPCLFRGRPHIGRRHEALSREAAR